MRAEQVLMGVVGVIGLYAVYRMVKTDGKSATENAALAPGAVSSPSGTPLLLKAQTQYRMRLELNEGLPPFSVLSSDADIASALTQLGFRDAQVFRSAPAWWGQGPETANPGPGTRFVIAQWGSATMTLPRPKALALLWQAKQAN